MFKNTQHLCLAASLRKANNLCYGKFKNILHSMSAALVLTRNPCFFSGQLGLSHSWLWRSVKLDAVSDWVRCIDIDASTNELQTGLMSGVCQVKEGLKCLVQKKAADLTCLLIFKTSRT